MKILIEKLLALEVAYERLEFILGEEPTSEVLDTIYAIVDSCIEYGPTDLKTLNARKRQIEAFYETHIFSVAKLYAVAKKLYVSAIEEREAALDFDFGKFDALIPPYVIIDIEKSLDPLTDLVAIYENIAKVRNARNASIVALIGPITLTDSDVIKYA